MSCSIFTISPSCGLRPLTGFFCSCKARYISTGTLSIPLITCFSRELSILVAVCSFCSAKSEQKHITELFRSLVQSPSLSTTNELPSHHVSTISLLSLDQDSYYLVNVFPTPGFPYQNRTASSPLPSSLNPLHLLNSSVAMSHSPTSLTRRS